MSDELAYVLINPYTIAKSRTGGVIARFLGRTDLNLVAARMFGPSLDLTQKYAALLRQSDSEHAEVSNLVADYVLNSYAPDPSTGKVRRVMLLLFQGDDAVAKLATVTGTVAIKPGSGQTIRDTYGDYVLDKQGRVQYFEPAVLVGANRGDTAQALTLWARYSETDGGLIRSATDVPSGGQIQKTLVLLKPDNFRQRSFRPGNIIDLLSSSALRIVGVKKLSMSVEQAEEFYGPVRASLAKKFREIGASRAAAALSHEFGFEVPESSVAALCEQLGPLFAKAQFDGIVKFMTGFSPSECRESEKAVLGRERCLALVYEGVDAVAKIRSIVGTTDPSKAEPGSVRREFGSNIMVNAAHASDSPENALREMRIVKVEEDTIRAWVTRYYGGIFSRMTAWWTAVPRLRFQMRRRITRRWSRETHSTAALRP